MNKYLPMNECFKETLNNIEISRIEDSELREIRLKYWNKRHDAFLNELEINDNELENVFDKIDEEEKKELENYKIKHNINL